MNNVAKRATPPKIPKHEAECFDLDEIQDILKAVENEPLKWQIITYMFIATGARRGEILGIKWCNVDFDNNTVYLCNNLLYSSDVGIYETSLKTDESRRVSVSSSVMELMREWKEEQERTLSEIGSKRVKGDYVFTQWNGEPMHPDSTTDYYAKFSKRYNLPHINPHKFRHTQASILINQGLDIVTVSKRLGHAKVSTTTDIYSHLLNKADERASNMIESVLFSNSKK